MVHEAKLSWFEQTDPIIESVITGTELGYYSFPKDFVEVMEEVEARLLEVNGFSEKRRIDTYSVGVGFVLGQIGERMHQRAG